MTKIIFFFIVFGVGTSHLSAQNRPKSALAAVILKGKKVYTQYCMPCHQADGAGAQNMVPPLTRNEYTLGSKPRIINIVLNGLNGEIRVAGDIYSNEMPPQSFLTNSEIAAVLTYVRKSFGNKASAVTTLEVKNLRPVKPSAR